MKHTLMLLIGLLVASPATLHAAERQPASWAVYYAWYLSSSV